MANLTPAIKGQLTKATKLKSSGNWTNGNGTFYSAVRGIFAKIMPREQAKHAAKKYVNQVA